jgi:transcriptional regulator with XRE-family HTH domain
MNPEETIIRDLQAWARAKYKRSALLARKLGVSKQLVSAWLTGKRTPTLHHGLALQKFLKAQALRDKRAKS